MISDKTFRTELQRTFLIEGLPEPLERKSSHLQIFDNYIHETPLRLRSIRVPETKEWTLMLQKRYPAAEFGAEWNIEEIHLTESEYEHFKPLEGNEIRKNRYNAEFDGRGFEFDVYLGALWGLNRARVRFADRDEMVSLVVPEFVVAEITDESFFDDSNLVNQNLESVRQEVERLLGASSMFRTSI
jgi:CYTH domain-containing protein